MLTQTPIVISKRLAIRGMENTSTWAIDFWEWSIGYSRLTGRESLIDNSIWHPLIPVMLWRSIAFRDSRAVDAYGYRPCR